MNEKRVVYTFIFGGDYDELKTPAVLSDGWGYVCFTDNSELSPDVWDVRVSIRERAEHELDDKRFAMKHMILFHIGQHDVKKEAHRKQLPASRQKERFRRVFGR